MKIILTEQCKSLRGSLKQGFGYAIVKRKNGFFSQRCNHKVDVPFDGHWRFIAKCPSLSAHRVSGNTRPGVRSGCSFSRAPTALV